MPYELRNVTPRCVLTIDLTVVRYFRIYKRSRVGLTRIPMKVSPLDAIANPVLTILFTNSDGIDITVWGADFASAGLDTLAYVPSFTTTPSATSAWPTLASLISSGKRVIIFLDAGADTSKVPYILPEFTYIWETAFDQTDPSFPCAVNRPSSLANQIPTGRMSLVNHFLDTTLTAGVLIPDTAQLNVTNAVSGVGSLGLNAATCAAIYGAYPNFLLVDCNSLAVY
jgi:hypothetical protein